MTYFQTMSVVVGFLGGGVVSALINWIRVNCADKRERKIRILEDQIRKLYGPLYYLISQSEKLFELSNRFHEAYNEEYCNQQWSQEEHTQIILEGETDTTLKIANKYIDAVENNNKKLRKILDENYPLLDPEDIKMTMIFFEHTTRMEVEKDKDGKIITPFIIYRHIGDISFLRPEVIDKIKNKFLNKKAELDGLVKD